MPPHRKYLKGQDGYTLVEVIIASALGVLLMSALTSVVLTSWRGAMIATSRVEASGQIRNFEFFAYDDFARSNVPSGSGCVQAAPCTTQPLVLNGYQVSNSTAIPAFFQVTYTWDGAAFLDRTVAATGATRHAATDASTRPSSPPQPPRAGRPPGTASRPPRRTSAAGLRSERPRGLPRWPAPPRSSASTASPPRSTG